MIEENNNLTEDETEDSSILIPNSSFLIHRSSLAKAWISYAVGVVMGQFKPGIDKGLGRGRFDCETAERLAGLADTDGLMVVDPSHPDDLAVKVSIALEIMVGEEGAGKLVGEALGNFIIPNSSFRIPNSSFIVPNSSFRIPNSSFLIPLRDYLTDRFFKEHTQKYRKRPIYWYLRSSKGSYGLWLYYHRLDKDLLFKTLLNYVEPKIRLEEDRLKTLRKRRETAGSSGREARQIEKDMDRHEQLVSELYDFSEKLRRAADLRIDFNLNDGVILNIAPLWELVPWKEPKKYWDELNDGKYDWSHIAYQLWPERVLEVCKRDRSVAIAHGMEEVYKAGGAA